MSATTTAAVPWNEVITNLWEQGYARLGSLLSSEACERLRLLYSNPACFRTRVEMERYRFGRGEYQYFAYPLPEPVAALRTALYPFLVNVANEWTRALSLTGEFPATLDQFLAYCHAHKQPRPTPLMLRYRAGDYNCLHQDLYGAIVFPFQVIIGLSRPGVEFTGGELLLTEQRPRAQSLGHVVQLEQGEALVIATRYRPVRGARGFYRANLRHGVSRIHSGERFTLGIIFHDAA
jgi:hypothetical protein